MLYRQATVNDVPELVALITKMVDKTFFEAPTPEKIKRLIDRTNGYFECAVHEGSIVGFLCGYVGETFLNNQFNAYDQGVFVTQEHRGGKVSIKLIRNFEDWARSKGAKNNWMSQSVGHKQDSTLKFFQRLGYKCQGFVTCKKL